MRQISQGEFTEKAWEAILGAPEVAQQNSHQIVETEHLMLVLLQQQDGLAARIFIKVRPHPKC
jgi:ATP-dependent Clp protease ATP-binding subunit ClpB